MTWKLNGVRSYRISGMLLLLIVAFFAVRMGRLSCTPGYGVPLALLFCASATLLHLIWFWRLPRPWLRMALSLGLLFIVYDAGVVAGLAMLDTSSLAEWLEQFLHLLQGGAFGC
ncbi:hypothetical protein [Andreprevotia lacus]|nr:hypothetical protein [Andreprevotia lacus]